MSEDEEVTPEQLAGTMVGAALAWPIGRPLPVDVWEREARRAVYKLDSPTGLLTHLRAVLHAHKNGEDPSAWTAASTRSYVAGAVSDRWAGTYGDFLDLMTKNPDDARRIVDYVDKAASPAIEKIAEIAKGNHSEKIVAEMGPDPFTVTTRKARADFLLFGGDCLVRIELKCGQGVQLQNAVDQLRDTRAAWLHAANKRELKDIALHVAWDGSARFKEVGG